YGVTYCENMANAIKALNDCSFSLALLDLSLPDGDGYTVFTEIKKKADIPVIFMTAADDEGNTVKALEMGADDYITKPFRVRELLARIKTVLRRTKDFETSCINLGSLKIDTAKALVYKNGGEVPLTALEYRLLLIFGNNPGQILTRSQILENLWDVAGNFVNDNTLTVYIKRLREKLEDDPHNPAIIRTIRGLGYKAGE
ncbi:response regulator transcription factor, partial [Tyzzerella sp. OttesenSCG-928-J15]|nr:response regulator transcription factor [Tyzzerella sp. OttesenSCG-928-J15]